MINLFSIENKLLKMFDSYNTSTTLMTKTKQKHLLSTFSPVYW